MGKGEAVSWISWLLRRVNRKGGKRTLKELEKVGYGLALVLEQQGLISLGLVGPAYARRNLNKACLVYQSHQS